MARSVYDIKQQITDEFLADPLTPADITTSKVSKWQAFIGFVAIAISVFEQILDQFTSVVESRIARAGVGTGPWLLDRAKEFRYGNAVDYDPSTGQWSYPDESGELIISRAGVSGGLNKVVNIKVATGEPPAALDSNQKEAFETYMNKIGTAGVQYNIVSQPPDRIYVSGKVIFDGQYSDSIEISVKTALRNLYATLSNDDNFGADIGVIAIINAVKNVVGVVDFRLEKATGRSSTITFPSSYFYDLSTGVNNLEYSPQAGYLIEEDTAGQTLDNSLVFEAE
jgi:hypothetical protein